MGSRVNCSSAEQKEGNETKNKTMTSEDICTYLQVPRKKASILQGSPAHKAMHCSMLADLGDLENLRIKSSGSKQENGKNHLQNGKEYYAATKNGTKKVDEQVIVERSRPPGQRNVVEKEAATTTTTAPSSLGPQAPVRRRRRSKRRKSELEECSQGVKKENISGASIEISDLPNELEQLLQESERQLQQLKADDFLRKEANGDARTEELEKRSGEYIIL